MFMQKVLAQSLRGCVRCTRSLSARFVTVAVCLLFSAACGGTTGSPGEAAAAHSPSQTPDALRTSGPALQGECPLAAPEVDRSGTSTAQHFPTSYTVHTI